MANYSQTKNIIDTNIVTNHNEDITAIVLNAVSTALIDYTKDVHFDTTQNYLTLKNQIGQLPNLNTVDKSSIVNAINEVLSTGGSAPYGVVRGKGFIGRSVTANVSGSYTVDFDDMAEHYILYLNDNTAIVFDNMISQDETVAITLTVQGNHSILLPSFLVASSDNDVYDGDMNNEIVINIKRGGTFPEGYYTLKSYEI